MQKYSQAIMTAGYTFTLNRDQAVKCTVFRNCHISYLWLVNIVP